MKIQLEHLIEHRCYASAKIVAEQLMQEEDKLEESVRLKCIAALNHSH